MNNLNWKKYALEFISIFIAVVSAFAINNWNHNRNNIISEQKILIEIKNGIEIDIQDFNGNIIGHKQSLRANQLFRKLIRKNPVPQDSIHIYYISLFRDYSPIIYRSGYESLKSIGIKTISNDSLRFQIITLYDYHYNSIEKLEHNVNEMQSFQNYFSSINELLHPYMEFDESGNLEEISQPIYLKENEKKEILSYLWRLETNRKFKLSYYEVIIEAMEIVKTNIETELER